MHLSMVNPNANNKRGSPDEHTNNRAHNLSCAFCEAPVIAEVSCAFCAALVVGLNGSAVGRATRTNGDSVAAGSGSTSLRVSEAERVAGTAGPVGCDGVVLVVCRAAGVGVGVLVNLVAGLVGRE